MKSPWGYEITNLAFRFKEWYHSNYQQEHDDRHARKVYSLRRSLVKSTANNQITSSNEIEVVFPTLLDWKQADLRGSFFFPVDSQILRCLFVDTVLGSPSYSSNRNSHSNTTELDLQPSIMVYVNLQNSNDCCIANSTAVWKYKTTSFRGGIDLSNGAIFLNSDVKQRRSACLRLDLVHAILAGFAAKLR